MIRSQFLEQMLNALAAPLAGIFLLLSVCLALPRAQTGGVWFELLREGSHECGDTRTEVVHWEEDGSVWINEEKLSTKELPTVVESIMRTRAERVVHVLSGQNTRVQQVAELTNRMSSNVPDLHLGILTHRQLRSMAYDAYGMHFVPVGCMRWPRCPGPLVEDRVPILAGCTSSGLSPGDAQVLAR